METMNVCSVREGIDIYSRSWESQRVFQAPINIPGGVYEGGDISIGGGQVIGISGASDIKSDILERLEMLSTLLKTKGNLTPDSSPTIPVPA